MFENLVQKINENGSTNQVEVSSTKLIPSVEMRGDDRVFYLEYDGVKHPCLEKGWTSWAEKVLAPRSEQKRKSFGLVDGETGRQQRWSISTIRKFLAMTPTSIVNTVVQSWWERHDPVNWHVIKYADNGSPGAIRYVGTNRYRLYKNEEFLKDLSNTDFSNMEVREEVLDEDYMILRLTSKEPLQIPGNNIFAGFNLLNSENGSSSISVTHMIYDLLCTNGLKYVFDKVDVLSQRHSRFDVEAFHAKVASVADSMPEIHESAVGLVTGLINMSLSTVETDAVLAMYQNQFDASESFVDATKELVKGRYQGTAWGLVSAITESAQRYNWRTRMQHEDAAGELATMITSRKFDKYLGSGGEQEAVY